MDYGPVQDSIEVGKIGTQDSDLFVFVGEKIEVVEFPPAPGEMRFDAVFDASYRVVEPVYGKFEGDVIKFRVFDHYGFPRFAEFKNVLLFVSKIDGKLYHEKYQYYDVYQTVDGRWASCGDPYRGMDYHREPFAPKNVEFREPVVSDLAKLNKQQIDEMYPSPYFEIAGTKAVCKMGAYVEELFEIKRMGVLKARGVGQ